MNGMVHGDSLTLDREVIVCGEKKRKIQQLIISFKIYNPGMLLFLTTEYLALSLVDSLTARMEPFFFTFCTCKHAAMLLLLLFHIISASDGTPPTGVVLR